jgi:hypothetical protein
LPAYRQSALRRIAAKKHKERKKGVSRSGAERLEGSRSNPCLKDHHSSFQSEEGQNMGLNRRLPRITQRDVLPNDRFDYSISRTRRQTALQNRSREPLVKKKLRPYTPLEK